jgi:hypothetical protein
MPSITITTDNGQAQRLVAAFRDMTGNPEAGEAEIKQWLVKNLRRIVIDYERQQAINAINAPSPFNPT